MENLQTITAAFQIICFALFIGLIIKGIISELKTK